MRRLLIYKGILLRRLRILQYLLASSAVQSCVLVLVRAYSLLILRLIKVPHHHGTFTICLKIMEQVRLLWNYISDNGVFLSECLLWVLLFPTFTENILDDGFLPIWFVLTQISGLGIIVTIVTLDDKFATPTWRYIYHLH